MKKSFWQKEIILEVYRNEVFYHVFEKNIVAEFMRKMIESGPESALAKQQKSMPGELAYTAEAIPLRMCVSQSLHLGHAIPFDIRK